MKGKKGGKLKWVIIVIVVLGVIGAAAGGGDDEESKTSDFEKLEQTNEETEKGTQMKTYHLMMK